MGIRAYFGCHIFHDSLRKVKHTLRKQTSAKGTTKTPSFYDPIIKQTLDSIIGEVLKTPYREVINPVKHKIWPSQGEYYLLTLEALHIRELKPQINTKDEYKSRELMIKL